MTMPADASGRPTTAHGAGAARPGALAALGLAVGMAGVLLYFVVLLGLHGRFPGIRNDAVPSWILVLVGVAISFAAVGRATRGRRRLAGTLAGLNGLVALSFAAFLYGVLAVPDANGPALGRAAPDFALLDQTGRTVRLAEFRGKPLLLVFYRGHW